MPMTERASREVLSLPVHPLLTHEDLDLIVRSVKEALA
jgi:dTDP-4-amino-4,6-dideoxygalactose transaminase